MSHCSKYATVFQICNNGPNDYATMFQICNNVPNMQRCPNMQQCPKYATMLKIRHNAPIPAFSHLSLGLLRALGPWTLCVQFSVPAADRSGRHVTLVVDVLPLPQLGDHLFHVSLLDMTSVTGPYDVRAIPHVPHAIGSP